MLNKTISVALATIFAIALCTGCGSKPEETQSFGLKDFDGFYYETSVENMDGYDVTNTYGYLLNGDGTGTFYGQDTVDITWNETEIHFDGYALNYDMEPGKLTVHDGNEDLEYSKLSGKFIKPNPVNVNMNALEDGIYPVDINSDGTNVVDGEFTITADIYMTDTYDIVDIGQMATGDIIFVDGVLYEVTSVETSDYGSKEINGGIEEGGTSLRSVEESNCYVFFGMDDMQSYSLQGTANIAVDENVTLTDSGDPSDEKVYNGDEAKDRLENILSNEYLNRYNCTIRVENGKVVEINKIYMP